MLINDRSRYITHENNDEERKAAANELGECLKNAMADCYANNTLTKEAYIGNIQKYISGAAHQLNFEPDMEVKLVDQYGRPWSEVEADMSMTSPLTGDRTLSETHALFNPLDIGSMVFYKERQPIPLEYIKDYYNQKRSGIQNPSIDILALGKGPLSYEGAKSYIESDPMYLKMIENGSNSLSLEKSNALESGEETESSNITEDGSLSESELREQLNSIISEQMVGAKKLATIFHYSTDEAIDIILKYDSIITSASEKYDVPKAIIQAALLREIRWIDVTDELADGFVIETKAYYDRLDNYMSMPFWRKLIVGAPKVPIHLADDSSTGLGQIFAKTAIETINWYNDKYKIYDSIDISDRNEYYDVWNKLRTDDAYNIEISALIHLKSADDMGINIKSLSEKDIKTLFGRYNASLEAMLEFNNNPNPNSKIAIHENQVYEYYKLFSKYNAE